MTPLLSDAIEYPEIIENIDPHQVDEVARDMSLQIKWRDFILLDQVHCMAAYRPNFKSGSFGVTNELLYSAMKGVTTYQYWPMADGEILRPFKDTGIISGDYSEFVRMLEEHQNEVNQYPGDFAHRAQFEV